MLSLEQLSQMVKEHLGLSEYIDGIQYSCKWSIKDSPLSGRGLIATEDIMPGEVLFVDRPLIYGPRAGTAVEQGCTVCGKLDSETFYKCSKCSLLLCAEQCQNTNVHFNDCGIISRWNINTPDEEVDANVLSRALTPVRALLLNKDQRIFLASLQAHTLPQHGLEIRNLKQYYEIPEEEEQLMLLACCALDTNAYQIATPYGKKEMSMRGLYPVSGLMNHNCVPNTRYYFNSDLQMTVKAVKPIRAGTEIFSCYSGILWGTPARRTHLYKTKHFLCKCDRCSDPTERGTLLGALKCFSTECSGYLIPIDPLKSSSAWRCLQCEMRVPDENVRAIQGALGSLMGSLNFESVEDLESFLVNRITKYIPKTNQIVIDLQCRLIWAFGEVEGYRWHGHVPTSKSVDWRRQSPAARCSTLCLPAHYHSSVSPDMAHPATDETSLLMAYLQEPQQPFWTIKRSDLGGRGLFASQSIKKGTLIFKNKPLVVAARADRAGGTYCTVCCRVSDSCYACERCTLMICSEDCKACEAHDAECNFITNNWKLKPDCDRKSGLLARMQIYLRFLLLSKEHKLLLSILQSCTMDTKFEELEILCTKYEIPEDQISFMILVHSIIIINSFRIANNPLERKIPLRGLFPLSAFLNHSCVPNTRNVFNSDFSMAVYATRDIEVGEEILTCYTGLLLCTPARRCLLYKTKYFWCKCERCKDTTEMGTKLSALKCFNKECVGILLPTSPLDPRVEWCCDNCATRTPPDEICTIQSILGSLVGSLDLDDKFRLEAAILARLANFIPYSNHIFIDLRLRLALKIGFTEGLKLNELSESRLALKESLCRGTLRTVAALGVGDAHLRGLLLYHLHAALAERARRYPDLYEEIKSEIESTIEQAYIILQGDISAPPDLELRRRYLGPGCDKPQEERFFILDA